MVYFFSYPFLVFPRSFAFLPRLGLRAFAAFLLAAMRSKGMQLNFRFAACPFYTTIR